MSHRCLQNARLVRITVKVKCDNPRRGLTGALAHSERRKFSPVVCFYCSFQEGGRFLGVASRPFEAVSFFFFSLEASFASTLASLRVLFQPL